MKPKALLPRRRRPFGNKGANASETIRPITKGNFVTLPIDLTVGESLGLIRAKAKRGDVFYLYVIDRTEKLVGIVSIRNLLLSADAEPLAEVVSRNVVTLSEEATKGEAAQRFSECRYLSLPIVDKGGKIQGVLHAQDLTPTLRAPGDQLFEDRHKGALFELLGIEAEDHGTSILDAIKIRFPWLLINMLGGAISAFLIERLAPGLPSAVAFLAFVPILLILCESIGMQTVSVVITKLRHAKGHIGRVGWREIRIAFWLGLISACFVSLAGLLSGAPRVAAAVGATMVTATLWVSGIAFVLPLMIRKLGIDPSVSSGPVVLAIADCTVLALYLFVSLLTTHFLG